MYINKIEPVEPVAARGSYKFRVTFNTGAGVEVSANELHSYPRFQCKVLEATGKLYCHAPAEWPRVGRMEWSSLLSSCLRDKDQAAGESPAPGSTGATSSSCEQSPTSIDLATKSCRMTVPDFEEFVANVFRDMGYAVEITPRSGDQGIDLLMRKDNQLVAVQCKRWSTPIGEPEVLDFYSALIQVEAPLGYMITTSSFTTQAVAFAQGKPVVLLDLDALVDLVTRRKGR